MNLAGRIDPPRAIYLIRYHFACYGCDPKRQLFTQWFEGYDRQEIEVSAAEYQEANVGQKLADALPGFVVIVEAKRHTWTERMKRRAWHRLTRTRYFLELAFYQSEDIPTE